MTLTNTTSNVLDMPGLHVPALGSATLTTERYLADETLRNMVNDYVADGTLTVASPPAGFPVATGEDTDTAGQVFSTPFVVVDSSGDVQLRVDETGVHIQTGDTVAADL